MSTYLVTGATGFVGATLTRRLLGEGCTVRVLARPERSDRAYPSGSDVRGASLGDPNAIAAAAVGCEVIYHCAAENSPRADPDALAWINVAGTENVVNAARAAGVRRVVHLSCADATLINRDRMSWKETQPLSEAPLDALCRGKLLAEELALAANDASLQVCVLRPAWVWGPGDRHTLPALCREAARGRVQLCGNGDNLVATVYIDNLVAALRLAAGAPRAPGHVYHVVDGEVLSAREFIGQLCVSLGLQPPARGSFVLEYAKAWLGERTRRGELTRAEVVRRGRSALLDATSAAHDLEYEPTTTIEQGMAALAEWAERMGGAAAIARTERSPATSSEIAAWVRVAQDAS